MGMSKSKLFRETLAAVDEFRGLHLWEEYGDSDCFALVVPGEEHPIVASILGQAGIEYGLNLVRGPRAAGWMRELLGSDAGGRDAVDNMPLMSFTMTRLRDIPPQRRKFLERARFEGTRDSLAPLFMVKDPRRRGRDLHVGEVEIMLYCLRGIAKAHAAGQFAPRPILSWDDLPTLVISGKPLDPDVEVEYRAFADTADEVPSGLAQMPADLPDLPKLDARWHVAFPMVPGCIEGDDRTIRAVLVADGESGRVVAVRTVLGGDIQDAADQLAATFRGENHDRVRGVPTELVFTSRLLFDTLGPGLAAADVRTSYEPRVPFVDEIVDDMRATMMGDADEAQEFNAAFDEDAPADDDLEGWKRVDNRVLRRALARMHDGRADHRKALRQYFGDPDWDFENIEPGQRDFAIQCFNEWVWTRCRRTTRSKTLAEKMLGGALPGAERRILEARIEAHPTLYRVVDVNRGRSLTCEDILLGGRAEVFDKLMSESAQVDWCVPMCAYQAGAFRLASPVGPPMSTHEAAQAVDFLAEEGLALDRDSLLEGSHLFGRLWEFVEELRSAPPPHFVNFDGEDVEFITGTYRIIDENAVRAALTRRDDIEPDDDESNTYRWVGDPTRPQPGMETVTLGRLQFVAGELLVETNSTSRLDRARAWLDKLPGLEFVDSLRRPLDEMMAEGLPLDERIGGPRALKMTPEIEAAIRAQLREQYFAWLDTPVPMFDGKTPREMAKAPKGRAIVAAHIRGFPRANDQVDMPVPVDEMLRELGLGGA
ncbi:MAG: DUF7309 domain-containing protein [Planctomycetota bacterium]|jgi:hypothetical protein